MKHLKEYKIFESNTDDYYKKIDVIYIIQNISKDRFIDIDNRVVNFVKTNISSYIKENNPRIRIFEDNSINSGIYSDNSICNLTIDGFDYSLNRGICHPVSDIKWIRNLRIFSLTDDYYIVYFIMGTGGIKSSSDFEFYSYMYFLCDQFDGLTKLLIDYQICDKPVNEGNIFKKEDYYTEMLYDDAHDMLKSTRLIFSDREKDILEDIADRKGHNYSIEIKENCINFEKINLSNKIGLEDFTKSVYKFEDEWYIFMKYNKKMSGISKVYYKCDGFEGLLKCINDMIPDIRSSNSYSLDENLDTDDKLVTKIGYNEWHNWVRDRRPENLNKKDTLVIFEIIKNLDPYYFGPTTDKYPFGKSRESSYWIGYNINEFRDDFIDRTLDEIKIMSDFFFTNNRLDGIHIKHYENHIHIDKYQDEWYDVIITSNQNDQIRYICDSIDGLKEVINMVGDLEFESNINESIELGESLVKKIEEYDYNEFLQTHKKNNHTEDDVEVYMDFINESFYGNEIEIDGHLLQPNQTWTAIIKELDEEEGDIISTIYINIDKFEDEWYLVEKQYDDQHPFVVSSCWLVDTNEGFQQLKNEIFWE